MVPALTARKFGMTPRMRFGCGGGVFCAAGFALSDCSPRACAPPVCVPWCSASAALAPALCTRAATEASCANEDRAALKIIAPVRNSVPMRRKAQPPCPKQTYPQSDASPGRSDPHPAKTLARIPHQDPVCGLRWILPKLFPQQRPTSSEPPRIRCRLHGQPGSQRFLFCCWQSPLIELSLRSSSTIRLWLDNSSSALTVIPNWRLEPTVLIVRGSRTTSEVKEQ